MIAYSESAVRNNHGVVEYCRTSMAALSGGTAGILGLTGFYGFGFYMFAVMGLWVIFILLFLRTVSNLYNYYSIGTPFVEGWKSVEEIFCQPNEPSHKWIHWRTWRILLISSLDMNDFSQAD